MVDLARKQAEEWGWERWEALDVSVTELYAAGDESFAAWMPGGERHDELVNAPGREYERRMADAWAALPPVAVTPRKGGGWLVEDGEHRVRAAIFAGRGSVSAIREVP